MYIVCADSVFEQTAGPTCTSYLCYHVKCFIIFRNHLIMPPMCHHRYRYQIVNTVRGIVCIACIVTELVSWIMQLQDIDVIIIIVIDFDSRNCTYVGYPSNEQLSGIIYTIFVVYWLKLIYTSLAWQLGKNRLWIWFLQSMENKENDDLPLFSTELWTLAAVTSHADYSPPEPSLGEVWSWCIEQVALWTSCWSYVCVEMALLIIPQDYSDALSSLTHSHEPLNIVHMSYWCTSSTFSGRVGKFTGVVGRGFPTFQLTITYITLVCLVFGLQFNHRYSMYGLSILNSQGCPLSDWIS